VFMHACEQCACGCMVCVVAWACVRVFACVCVCGGGGGHAPSCTRTHSSVNEERSWCCSRRVQEREVAASQAFVMMHWHMRARGPCGTRSNAATRLHMHRRLQAGIDVLSFPSRLQAATFRAVVDSALQSVHNDSTTGCGRVGRALRSPAVACCTSRPRVGLVGLAGGHWY
jgi:hypothetical protein